MTNPFCDPYLVLIKVYQGGKYLKQAINDTPVEPLNRARTVKICYGVMEKNVYLDYIIGANTVKSPKTPVKTVLKIALYMLIFMDKHDYMVVDYAVELIKKLGKEGTAGFVNAFLRSYKIPPLPERADEIEAVKLSVPLWLYKKIKRSYKNRAAEILSAKSKGVCVRFESGADAYLTAPHIKTPFDGVYIFENFSRDINYDRGCYTFQSVGSAAICGAVKECETLLDACAAPGGKSVLLSKKCKFVTACELHPHRVELIESYIKRMGVTNVAVRQADSSKFIAEFENKFDCVLCDVPCSGTGVINENPDIMFFRKEGDVAGLQTTQLAILNNCARYVKAGGTLYYSTCSVLPEENDTQSYNFLSAHPDFTLSIPSSPLGSEKTKFGLQFLPDISLGAGFYITSFVKNI